MDRLTNLGKVLATIGGAAWTVKSLVIISMNDHFQPIEGVLYFIGVGGIAIGALGLAAFLARRWNGPARWIGYILVAAATLALTAVASSFVQNLVAGWYTGPNVGIEDEVGILTPGLLWLIVGLYMILATRPRAETSERA